MTPKVDARDNLDASKRSGSEGSPVPSTKGPTDLTGRDRILSNLLSGWIAQALQLASGFVLPRLISDRLGQGSLGVWDFGWAVVSYFMLLQGGIVSSVNRYVAKYRVTGDDIGVNQSVNSVRLILNGVALAIAILSIVAAWILPSLMREKLAGLTYEATGVILMLGLTSAVEIQGAVFGGVLTGCHRWTVHNGIKTVTAIVSVVGGLVVICCGGGIVLLSGVMLLSEIGMRLAQRAAASRVCPELVLSKRHFSWTKAKEMMIFGGKSYINVISQMFSNQTASVIIASTFGVGALALFSRPRSLVRSIATVVQLNAMVMVPMVSAIEAGGRIEETRQLALHGTRYAVFFCLPILIFLVCMGGDVMHLWMGGGYVNNALLAIFAVTGLVEAMYFPFHRLLMGLNRHGKFATLNLIAAIAGATLALICVLFPDRDISWIAMSIALPSLFVNGILLPIATSRILKMRLSEMFRETWGLPILCCLPAAIGLISVASLFHGSPIHRLLLGAVVAVTGSAWFYWRFAVPAQLKNAVIKRTARFLKISKS